MPPDTPTPERDTVVILLAAGASARMNGHDKLWVELDGAPVIAHSLRTLARLPRLERIVVVAPADKHPHIAALAHGLPVPVRAVEGGDTRQASVAAGLDAAMHPDIDGPEFILVHDAARPLVTLELAARVLADARRNGAAIPVIAVADTIKHVTADGGVDRTLDRASLRAVQTPQAFAAPLLQRAHRAATPGAPATDDAALLEAQGIPVHTVEGDPANLKLTTPTDLILARALLQSRTP